MKSYRLTVIDWIASVMSSCIIGSTRTHEGKWAHTATLPSLVCLPFFSGGTKKWVDQVWIVKKRQKQDNKRRTLDHIVTDTRYVSLPVFQETVKIDRIRPELGWITALGWWCTCGLLWLPNDLGKKYAIYCLWLNSADGFNCSLASKFML